MRVVVYLSFIGIYGYCCWLMLMITAQYIPYQEDVAFLRIKQAEVTLPYYLSFFYLHVYTSILALLAGFTQFSRWLRHQYPFVHRSLGWLYVIVIVVAAGPSGLVLGYYANGGWSSQLAFCLLGLLWLWFTTRAVHFALQKDWQGHRRAMIRSFALTLSAITLRSWKWLLVALFTPKPMDVYRWVAWLGWVVNLMVAEWIIYRYVSKANN